MLATTRTSATLRTLVSLSSEALPRSYCDSVTGAWFESVAVAQQRAKKRLPKSVYGALIAGAERGLSIGDNTAAFDEFGFRPIAAGQPQSRHMAVEVMGQPISMPVLISPTGVQAVHPDGEVAAARASAARGIGLGLSSFASKPLEEVIAANPQTFFQLYWAGDRESILARMEHAKRAGACGLILTLDWSFVHSRDWGSPAIPQAINLRNRGAARTRSSDATSLATRLVAVRRAPRVGGTELRNRRWSGTWILRGIRRLDEYCTADVG